jgi:type I restriction enzyme S subunit
MTKLSDVATIIMGQSPPGKSYNREGKGLPLLNGAADFDGKNIRPVQFSTKPVRTSKKGDILICIRATIGNVTISDKEYCLGRGTAAIRVTEEKVDPFYLAKMLEGRIEKLVNSAKGSTIKGIKKNDLEALDFAFPSLDTQNRIFAVLEKAEQLEDWRKEADRLTDDYLNSVFLKVFGDPEKNPRKWGVIKINDVVEYSQYGTSIKSNSQRIGYPIVGMGNITYDGHLEMSDHSYVELPKTEFEKLKLRKGDVIFNRTNSTELVGKTACWNLDLNAVLASYLVRLRLKENANPIFFTCLMNTRFFKRLFSLRCKKAVNQSNISPTLLKKFDIYLPPIELQNKFASIVKQVEQMKPYQEKSKRQIGNFLNTLMQKAFGGKLVC